jgi:hypothetical protein
MLVMQQLHSELLVMVHDSQCDVCSGQPCIMHESVQVKVGKVQTKITRTVGTASLHFACD